MRTIWIIEDEEGIRDFLVRGLTDDGYRTVAFADGTEAWQQLEQERRLPDLMLLDVRMPGMSGLELCRRIRALRGYAMPIIMLTALGTTEHIVEGLHAGADDYVVKPFRFAEVLARIESSLRRQQEVAGDVITCGDLRIDIKAHKVTRGTTEYDLSVKELRLLTYMVEHQGELLSRSQLLRDVWDRDFDTNTNVVDVYIRYLREKIDQPFSEKMIHTVVGAGYVLKAQPLSHREGSREGLL